MTHYDPPRRVIVARWRTPKPVWRWLRFQLRSVKTDGLQCIELLEDSELYRRLEFHLKKYRV